MDQFYFRYLNIRVGKPSLDDNAGDPFHPRANNMHCNPFQCRLRDCTYSAPLLVDFEYVQYKDVNKQLKVVCTCTLALPRSLPLTQLTHIHTHTSP